MQVLAYIIKNELKSKIIVLKDLILEKYKTKELTLKIDRSIHENGL